MQSLLYLPFALANALTARLNAGYVFSLFTFSSKTSLVFFVFNTGETSYPRVPLVDELWVLLGYCIFTGLLLKRKASYLAVDFSFFTIQLFCLF